MERELTVFKKYKHYISYLCVGGITTAVSWASYYVFYELWGCSNTLSNVLSWMLAVAFAYAANKIFVFDSKSWKLGFVVQEAVKFTGSRLLSGVLELGLMYVLVDMLGYDGMIMKIAVSVIIVITNYVTSRFLVFGDKHDNK